MAADDGELMSYEDMEEGAGVLWNMSQGFMQPCLAGGEDETGRMIGQKPGKTDCKNLAQNFEDEKRQKVRMDPVSLEGSSEDFDVGKRREPKQDKFITPKKLFGKNSTSSEDNSSGSLREERRKGRQGRSAVLKNLRDRVVAMENKYATMEQTVERMKAHLKEMESKGTATTENDRGRVITNDQLMEFIKEALSASQAGIGCSKAFIRKFLLDRFEVPLTPHYIKKTNVVLQLGLAQGKFHFDSKHGLFRL